MNFETRVEAGTQHIVLKGRFTFTDYQDFRRLVREGMSDAIPTHIFDLSELEFMDSAALGMLLLARDEAQKRDLKIALRGPRGQVRRVLEVARFDTMFDIQDG